MSRNTFPMLTLGLATLLCSQADARLVEIWSFQRLNDTADAVLIGTVASTEQCVRRQLLFPFSDN